MYTRGYLQFTGPFHQRAMPAGYTAGDPVAVGAALVYITRSGTGFVSALAAPGWKKVIPMAPRRKKKRRSPLRRAAGVLYSLLVALSAVVVVGFCAYRLASKAPEQVQVPDAVQPSAQALSGGGQEQTGLTRKEKCYTVLLVCPDQTSGNADAITVAMYDTANHTACLVSIPRDTMTEEYPKINAAYHNGPEEMRRGVSDLLGIPLDYYITIDIQGFEALVDEVGGIDYNIPVHMGYDDPTQNLHIHYEPGLTHLNGQQAMEVCRFRHSNDGSGTEITDVGRCDIRNDILGLIVKKVLTNPQKIGTYIELFNTYVKSDMPLETMLWFAEPLLGLDLSANLESATLPGNGEASYRGVNWCYQLYPEECLEIMNRVLNPYTTAMTLDMMNIFQAE